MSIWKKAGIKVQITGRSKIAAAIITGALAVFIAVELAEFFKPEVVLGKWQLLWSVLCALGAGAAPEALDRAFLDELTALNDLFHREYGVPLTLSELGVSRDDLPAVAKQARYDGAALYNETEITLEDAMTVLEAAY